VNLDRFLSERRALWDELNGLVASARGRPERLGPRGARRLGTLYRSAAADLALARRRFPGDPVVRRLEDLVGRARNLVYDAPSRRDSLRRFFATGYWRRVAERPLALGVAALLLLAPAGLAATWALRDPAAAIGLVPGQFREAAEPRPAGEDLGLSAGQQAAFSSHIMTNNIRVTFVAFAGGIALGLLTAAVTIYNGLFLGAVAGLAVGSGGGLGFLELVVAHGVLELSCIVVAAAAGLRLGWSIVEPGRRTRATALADEARKTVEMVLGTAPWLVVAGLVEGFVTPAGLGAPIVVTVGVGLGLLYWTLVVWRGRAPRSTGAVTTGRVASP
jgi:uncharacterized membrane protein SpoIIM required for sporulation